VTHPITAGGGKNIAHEVHVYDPASEFQKMVVTPAQSIPVIIGEFGPMHSMTMSDCSTLMDLAQQHNIPHLAWTFHMRCPPNLVQDLSGGGCGIGMSLQPTQFGTMFKNRLAQPW
jgi:hypothetical protein